MPLRLTFVAAAPHAIRLIKDNLLQRYSIVKFLVWVIFALTVILLFALPIVSGKLIQNGLAPDWLVDSLGMVRSLQTVTMQGLIVGWVFFLGACFASFLNVVAWRVPRGRGINGSSHCPHCDVRLRMADNLPVVGWLKNGGRCRDCRSPITVRYLIVEIILGTITLTLVALEVFWSGINLPGTGLEHSFRLIDNLIGSPRLDLIQTVCFHLVMIYGLFTATVIGSERLPIPRSIVLVFSLIGLGLSAGLPHSYAVDWQGTTMPQLGLDKHWLATAGLGITSGLIAGLILDRLSSDAHVDLPNDQLGSPTTDPDEETAGVSDNQQKFGDSVPPAQVASLSDGVATLLLVGLFMGWQAVLAISIILSLSFPIRRVIRCWCCPSLASQVSLLTLVYLVIWRLLA